MEFTTWCPIIRITCGGKTTIAQMLQNAFPSSIMFKQDDYFHDENSKHHIIIPELNHANWECLNSVNFEALVQDVTSLVKEEPKENDSMIIVDGHLIFNYLPLGNLFHKKFFITLKKEECWERRRIRVYNPADPPGYFDLCVWPMYLKNKEEMERQMKDIVYLNGTDDKMVLFQKVMSELHQSGLHNDNH